jgi:hypothetical protein
MRHVHHRTATSALPELSGWTITQATIIRHSTSRSALGKSPKDHVSANFTISLNTTPPPETYNQVSLLANVHTLKTLAEVGDGTSLSLALGQGSRLQTSVM